MRYTEKEGYAQGELKVNFYDEGLKEVEEKQKSLEAKKKTIKAQETTNPSRPTKHHY